MTGPILAPLPRASLRGLKRADSHLGLVALLAAASAFAYLAQGPSSPALGHYTLVKSLARGTALIDETRFETGSQRTHDVAFFDGHYYSNKAPGLAFVALPAYVALDAAGVRTSGDQQVMLWSLGLVGAVLPAVLLFFLVRAVADRAEPGFGTTAAATLGLGSLLTTFATVFFPHALSAFLVFAAFVLLLAERRGGQRLALVAGAGALAGYAVTTEYHNVVAVLVLGAYALARGSWRRRAPAYAAGVLAGVAPLLLYNAWAFGSATHLSYEGTVLVEGTSGHDVLFRVDRALALPEPATVVALVLSRWGLLGASPVFAAGIAGAVLLYRRGSRAEALTIAGIALGYLLYSASYYEPFGQVPPGPRFLVPALAFLAVPLALAYRTFPLPTAGLAAGSIAVASTVTVTRPHIAWDGDVLYRLVHPSWWSPTVADLAGVTGWYRILPLVGALVVAVTCAVLATPSPAATGRGLLGAALVFASWIATVSAASRLLDDGWPGPEAGALVLLGIVALLIVATAFVVRSGKGTHAATRSSRDRVPS